METNNNVLNGTALDGHIFKFNWNVDIPICNSATLNQNISLKFAPDFVYSSSEFSMSESCHIKWKMIYQEMGQMGIRSFKIGLKRLDSDQCVVETFCSLKINFEANEAPKCDSFHFKFSQNVKEYFTQVMELPSLSTKVKPMANFNFPQTLHMFQAPINYTLRITGLTTTRNCCKVMKEKNEAMKDDIFQLQQDFKTFFKNKQMTDVTLSAKNELLPAHKFVLCARSPMFQRMFSQDFVEGNENNVRIDDIDKRVMEVFLSFLYTGVVEDREFSTVFELYSVADKYEVATLFETCRHILTSLLSIHTVSPVLKLADMHSDGDLKEIAVKYICDNFSKVEKTAEWGELLDEHPRLASHALRRVSASIPK